MSLIRGAGFDDASGRWVVPTYYNEAVDCLDHHDRRDLAMIFADFTGAVREVTWGEMIDRSHQFGRMFLERGCRRGDVVAVLLPQVPEAAAAYAGALRIGAVLFTMTLGWSELQITQRLEASAPTVLVTERSTLDRLGAVPEGVASVILLDDKTFDGSSAAPVAVRTRADDAAHLYYTSGTSGPAKALVHAHRSLIGHNEFEVSHGLRPGERFLGGGEWAWSHAKLFGPWRHDATQFVYRSERGFDAEGLIRAAGRSGVTNALLSPTIIKALRSVDDRTIADSGLRFRTVCSSNEPLDVAAHEWFASSLGCQVREYYGLTESYPMLGYRADETVRPGSTGRPLPGWHVDLDPSAGDVKAVVGDGDGVGVGGEASKPDATLGAVGAVGTVAAAGTAGSGDRIGEALLEARSNPQYPLGYWHNVEASARAFDGAWFRTGDMFRVDAEGYWYFIGRNDDVIKTAGYRVGPSEIEAILESHPAVDAAGVIGVPDPARGSVVCAYVVAPTVTDEARLAAELQDWVRERYSRFGYPKIVRFVGTLPRSSTGKVQRSVLRELSAREPVST